MRPSNTEEEAEEAGRQIDSLRSKSDDAKNNDADKFFEFEMTRDVYVFICLLVTTGIWTQLRCSDKCVVLIFTLFALAVQVGSMGVMIYVGFNDKELGEIKLPEINGSLQCDSGLIAADNCVLVEHNIVYDGFPETSDYVARCISIALIMCYIYSNFAQSVKTFLIIQHFAGSDKKARAIPWIGLFLVDAFIIMTTIWVVTRIVTFSTSLLDALSVGIGFIILMEVDDHLYQHAKNISFRGIDYDKIFWFRFEREKNYFIQNGIFYYVDVQIYSALVFVGFTISSMWSIVGLMLRYDEQNGVNYPITIDGIFYFFVVGIAVFLPWIPFRKCISKR